MVGEEDNTLSQGDPSDNNIIGGPLTSPKAKKKGKGSRKGKGKGKHRLKKLDSLGEAPLSTKEQCKRTLMGFDPDQWINYLEQQIAESKLIDEPLVPVLPNP